MLPCQHLHHTTRNLHPHAHYSMFARSHSLNKRQSFDDDNTDDDDDTKCTRLAFFEPPRLNARSIEYLRLFTETLSSETNKILLF